MCGPMLRVVAVALCLGPLAACDEADTPGEALDKAIQNTGEAVREAGETIRDAGR
jgi:hypothetical protein